MELLNRVAPDTELAGYPTNSFAGYRISGRISGSMPSAVYICIIRQGHLFILLKAATISVIFKVFPFCLRILISDYVIIWQEILYLSSRLSGRTSSGATLLLNSKYKPFQNYADFFSATYTHFLMWIVKE